MKRNICLVVALGFVLSLIGSPVLAKKAGEIKDGVYIDSDYNFSFKVPVGWAGKVKNAKYAQRIALAQTSPVPPRHFSDSDLRDYMQIPSISVIVDTTSLEVGAFVDGLLDAEFDSKQKKGLMKLLKLIAKPHDIMKRREITFADKNAVLVEARQAYSMEVSRMGSDRASVVNDYKYGAIFFTVREGNVYIVHMICEYQTSNSIMEMFNGMLNSLQFNGTGGAVEESG